MIHRAVLGSTERFFGILIGHYKGKWPFWLSPRQVIVCSVSEKSQAYAVQVKEQINEAGYYVDVDISDRIISAKVGKAQVDQYNYILVVGEKEMKNKKVSVRLRDENNFSLFSMDELLKDFKKKVDLYQ